MKRTFTVMMMVIALAVSSMSMATAYEVGERDNAANNKNQCEDEDKAGGTFTVVNGVNTCTIEFDGEPVIFQNAGNSENGWSTATTGTVVVEKGTGQGQVVSVDVIEACYNPGGKLMKPGSGKCPAAD